MYARLVLTVLLSRSTCEADALDQAREAQKTCSGVHTAKVGVSL